MNILFVTPRFPYPVVGGDRLKPYNILSYLARSHKVTLVSLYQGKDLPGEYLHAMESLGLDVHYIPFSPIGAAVGTLSPAKIRLPFEISYYSQKKLKDITDKLLSRNHFDLGFSFFMRTAAYLKDKPVKKILMAEDCRTLYQKRSYQESSSLKQKAVRFREYRALRTYEPDIVNYFDVTTLVTREDINEMKKQNSSAKYRLLTNGTDIRKFVPGNAERKGILFAGKLDVWANVLMIRQIVEEIFPRVKEAVPDAVLNIVGANPSSYIKSLASESINIIPNVPDMLPYLQEAALFLHPHSGGTGIQNKLLEAMACSCPVVTTPTGNQGIAGTSGRDLLIGSNMDELVKHAVYLLNNMDFAAQIGENSRKHIVDTHSWESVFTSLDDIMEEVMQA